MLTVSVVLRNEKDESGGRLLVSYCFIIKFVFHHVSVVKKACRRALVCRYCCVKGNAKENLFDTYGEKLLKYTFMHEEEYS